jgi:hypothetical protein
VQHSTLVAMGVRWLSRQCSVVLYEFATEADENPDVIGWAPGAVSVLIECKLSRSDFLRDVTKTVRRNPRAGMGHRRYYLCPPDLIQVKDLVTTKNSVGRPLNELSCTLCPLRPGSNVGPRESCTGN